MERNVIKMTNEERIKQVQSVARTDQEAVEMLLSASADLGSESGVSLSMKAFPVAAGLISDYFRIKALRVIMLMNNGYSAP